MVDEKIDLDSQMLVANWQTLMRTFIRPENAETRQTLIKYMEQILFGLHDFLRQNVGITEEKSLKELAVQFSDTNLFRNPEKKLADVITDLIQELAPHAVNVASPYFIGHMTAAIPFFMVHLKTIAAALNQNVVKLETSKVFSILEKQLLAKLHRLVFCQQEGFYATHVQSVETALGCFTEDGTTANMTALWVARNRLLAPCEGFLGVEREGIAAAYRAYGVERCVILVSRMGHYSLRKAGGVLGIGNQNVLAIDVDENFRIDINKLQSLIEDLKKEGHTRILAVVGIAGTTETGSVDPLDVIGDICAAHNIHFHVDAAWGGPTLMSETYAELLSGIEKADSVTIDGHKQFYMPMSCGMVFFRNPQALDAIAYHSRYINRPGSVDLGIKSFSGSREASSLILDSALKIMGTGGYGLLVEHGIQTAREFALEIASRGHFELTSTPELNIFTYRFFPYRYRLEIAALEQGDLEGRQRICKELNDINRDLHRLQREAGKSFVSRTTLKGTEDLPFERVVLRAVIMNPMTNIAILREILDEQEDIYHTMIG
ncbi:MAG: pyridoxal-dependent decarboxylase [Desulforhopalus sp.]